MRTVTVSVLLATTVAVAGCADMSDTQRRTATGAGVGAATGAVLGSFSANAGAGARIGAGVGALGGYVYDQNKK